MSDLATLAINAHGGLDRWRRLKTLSAHLVQFAAQPAADALRHCVPKWLRFADKQAPATLKALAAETEPPQVSGLVVAQIQWQGT